MQKIIPGTNDLLTVAPYLVNEWHYEKNGELSPSNLLPGSHKKVWWKCPKGHEWEAIIRDRVSGKKCPYCSNTKLLTGYNDLETVKPEIAKEWNYEKNVDLYPNQVKYSANIKVWWKCEKGHEWEAYVFNRSKGSGCPFCHNCVALAGYNDLATLNPEFLKEWDYEKNGEVKPSDVLPGAHKVLWWKCEKGHEWRAEVRSRNRGENCPYCSNKRVLEGFNDLYSYCKSNNRDDLIREFDNEKNQLSMKKIIVGSHKVVWWKCPKGHSYSARPYRRIKYNVGCGICSHNILLKNENDLLTTNPDIAREWDYSKNKKKPDEVMAGSNIEKYWFICPKGHSYEATPLSRKKGSGCPICSMERHTSFPEKAIFYYMKKAFIDAKENYRSPFLGRKEIDIYLPEYKIGVEYDGVAWHKDSKRDFIKDEICKKNDITLIRIREIGCCEYKSDSIKISIPPYDTAKLSEAIRFILCFINQQYHVDNDVDMDVDIERDRINISDLIEHSEKINSIASYCPNIMNYWDYEKNGKITPDQISHSSMKKVHLKCDKGHEWELVISNFNRNSHCPYCSGRKVLTGINDLFTTNPELKPLWSKNNTIDPTKIKSGCNKRALWKCTNCGGEYDMKVIEKVRTPGCPYCSGHRVLKGYNDLATLFPDLINDWNYEKNYPLEPDEVTKGSSKKVWWKCHVCEYEWMDKVYDRSMAKRMCPRCRKKYSNKRRDNKIK